MKRHARTTLGTTPLILAVKKGDIDMVKCLLENGADAKLENTEGISAIIIASKLKNNGSNKVYEEIFKLLIPKLKFYNNFTIYSILHFLIVTFFILLILILLQPEHSIFLFTIYFAVIIVFQKIIIHFIYLYHS